MFSPFFFFGPGLSLCGARGKNSSVLVALCTVRACSAAHCGKGALVHSLFGQVGHAPAAALSPGGPAPSVSRNADDDVFYSTLPANAKPDTRTTTLLFWQSDMPPGLLVEKSSAARKQHRLRSSGQAVGTSLDWESAVLRCAASSVALAKNVFLPFKVCRSFQHGLSFAA